MVCRNAGRNCCRTGASIMSEAWDHVEPGKTTRVRTLLSDRLNADILSPSIHYRFDSTKFTVSKFIFLVVL